MITIDLLMLVIAFLAVWMFTMLSYLWLKRIRDDRLIRTISFVKETADQIFPEHLKVQQALHRKGTKTDIAEALLTADTSTLMSVALLLNKLEILSLGANEKLLDERILNRLIGSMILEFWIFYQPYVRSTRLHNLDTQLYSELERFVHQIQGSRTASRFEVDAFRERWPEAYKDLKETKR